MIRRSLFQPARRLKGSLGCAPSHFTQDSILSFCFRNASTTGLVAEADHEYHDSQIDLAKVLIANRGEIACRVIRSCQKWNIPTVSVYSSADGPNAWHASLANEAYQIGTGPAPQDSYLRQEELLDIAVRTGCQAIHPGYGFLSENASFAKACDDANIQFIGPPASAIHSMGDKSESKAIMEAAGVPTTPGYYETNTQSKQDPEMLRHKAVEEVGFPLLIKAVAGGGGKGMRIVWKESEFAAALESCQRESAASFGNDTVLLEKFLYHPRHIEVQVIADTHGNVLHLYERDCSVQRRHQKVFEEAPALDLHPSLRHNLGEMGKRAAQAVGYVNAGTVEFLLDTNNELSGTPEQPFYFCEMNTRLQVEHPVSELITGIDLVEWQLRIAAGQPLPITNQEDVPCHGHAIEARVYAENPARNFLPAKGALWRHEMNVVNTTTASQTSTNGSSFVRVDTGLRSSQDAKEDGVQEQVSVYYDPMISKVIVHGQDRPEALRQMVDALQNYQIAGVPTNLPFLVKCAKHPNFQKGGKYVNTGFLEDYADDVKMVESDDVPPPMAQVAGSLAILLNMENRIIQGKRKSVTTKSPWSSNWGSWRIGGSAGRPCQKIRLFESDKTISVWKNRDGSYDVQVATDDAQSDQEIYHVQGWLQADGNMEMIVNGTHRMKLTSVFKVTSSGIYEDHFSDSIQLRMWPEGLKNDYFWQLDVENPMVSIPSENASSVGSAAGSGVVKSPMPGKISRVNFKVGDFVHAGDVVVVMEAMKMEHALASSCAGIVTEIRCQPNDVVNDGAVVFIVENSSTKDAES